MSITVMKQMIEALQKAKRQCQYHNIAPHGCYDDAIDAGRQAIALKESLVAEAEKRNWESHDLYTDADKDRPDIICDSNGQVTLGLCKRCGKGECELSEPCIAEEEKQGCGFCNHSLYAGTKCKNCGKEAEKQRSANEHLEPVAWWNGNSKFATPKAKDWDRRTGGTTAFGCDIPLYTSPPQRHKD